MEIPWYGSIFVLHDLIIIRYLVNNILVNNIVSRTGKDVRVTSSKMYFNLVFNHVNILISVTP